MSLPLEHHADELRHAIGTVTIDAVVTGAEGPLSAPERLAQQVRVELLPVLEEVFAHPDVVECDAAIQQLDIDLGTWPAAPDWVAVRAQFRDQLRAALAPYLRRRNGLAAGGQDSFDRSSTSSGHAGHPDAGGAMTEDNAVASFQRSDAPGPPVALAAAAVRQMRERIARAEGADAFALLRAGQAKDPAQFETLRRAIVDVQHRNLLERVVSGQGTLPSGMRVDRVQRALTALFAAAGHPSTRARGFAAQITAQLLLRPVGAALSRGAPIEGPPGAPRRSRRPLRSNLKAGDPRQRDEATAVQTAQRGVGPRGEPDEQVPRHQVVQPSSAPVQHLDLGDAAAIRTAWAAAPATVETRLRALDAGELRALLSVLLPKAAHAFHDAVDTALDQAQSAQALLLSIVKAALKGRRIDFEAARAEAALATQDDRTAARGPEQGAPPTPYQEEAGTGPLYGPAQENTWAAVLALLAAGDAQLIDNAAPSGGSQTDLDGPAPKAVFVHRPVAPLAPGTDRRALHSSGEVSRDRLATGHPDDDFGEAGTAAASVLPTVSESDDGAPRRAENRAEHAVDGAADAPEEEALRAKIARRASEGAEAPPGRSDATASPQDGSQKAAENDPPAVLFRHFDAGSASSDAVSEDRRSVRAGAGGAGSAKAGLPGSPEASAGTGDVEAHDPTASRSEPQGGTEARVGQVPTADRGGSEPVAPAPGAPRTEAGQRLSTSQHDEERRAADDTGSDQRGPRADVSGPEPLIADLTEFSETKSQTETSEASVPRAGEERSGVAGAGSERAPDALLGAGDPSHLNSEAPDRSDAGTTAPVANHGTTAPVANDGTTAIDALSDAAFGAAAPEVRHMLSLIGAAVPASVLIDLGRRLPGLSLPAERDGAKAGDVPDRLVLELIAAVGPRPVTLDGLLRHVLGILVPDAAERRPILRQLIARLRYSTGGRAPALQDKVIQGLEQIFAGGTAPQPKVTSPREAVESRAARRLLTQHAGLVLFHPFLKLLFSRLDLLTPDTLMHPERLGLGRATLETLAGAHLPPQRMDPMARILLGLGDDQPPPPPVHIADDQATLIDGLMRSVIAQWSKLGQTSPKGLQDAFIRRGGQIRFDETGAHLRVDPGPFDMLLDGLPWTLDTMIALPWMTTPCHVSWRSQDG